MASRKRRIVLTGVSRGLGRAMCEGFIAKGQVVLGCARSAQAIAALTRHFGPPHRFDVVDVGRDADVRAWATVVLADAASWCTCSYLNQATIALAPPPARETTAPAR